MAAKVGLVLVSLLAWIVCIDLHGIKTNATVDVGCDGHDCVETILDHRDSEAVDNVRTKRSITCEDAGGTCMPSKKQEKCKKSIIRKYKCSSKKKVCCIEALTTVTPTTTTQEPTPEVNQCLKNGTKNSDVLQKLNNVDYEINTNLDSTEKSIKSCIHNAKDDMANKIGSLEHKLEDMETKMQAKLDYIIKHLVPPTTTQTTATTTTQPTAPPTKKLSTVPPTTTQSTVPPTTTHSTVAATTTQSTVPPTTTQSTVPPTTTTTPTTGITVNPALNWTTVDDGDRFVLFRRKMNWTDARALCRDNGLDIYHSFNITAVILCLIDNFGHNWWGGIHYWVGGRGNGSHQVWVSGQEVERDEPWYYGADNYGYSARNEDCMYIADYDGTMWVGNDNCDCSGYYYSDWSNHYVICG